MVGRCNSHLRWSLFRWHSFIFGGVLTVMDQHFSADSLDRLFRFQVISTLPGESRGPSKMTHAILKTSIAGWKIYHCDGIYPWKMVIFQLPMLVYRRVHSLKMQVEHTPILPSIASHPRNYFIDTLGVWFQRTFAPNLKEIIQSEKHIFQMGCSPAVCTSVTFILGWQAALSPFRTLPLNTQSGVDFMWHGHPKVALLVDRFSFN